jgi:myosin I
MSNVYYVPHPTLIWTLCKLASPANSSGMCKIRGIDGSTSSERAISWAEISEYRITNVQEIDVIPPNFLHAVDVCGPAVFDKLRRRSEQGQPYTLIGSILLSINTYNWKPKLFERGAGPMGIGDTIALTQSHVPHVFTVAQTCINGMIGTEFGQSHQSIILLGTCGSGKTESMHCILDFLSRETSSSNNLHARLNCANTIFESFGNAATAANPNSSRYARLIQLYYDPDMLAQKCTNSLIFFDKDRVINRCPEDDIFHIFNYLLFGLDAATLAEYELTELSSNPGLSSLGIKTPSPGYVSELTGKMEDLRKAWTESGIPQDLVRQFELVVAGVLHVSCIQFVVHQADDTALIADASVPFLSRTAKAWGVDEMYLRRSLTYRELPRSNPTAALQRTPMNVDQAIEVRGIFCKEVFARLFKAIGTTVNSRTGGKHLQPDEEAACMKLSIFDSPGFVCSSSNCMEHLLINYIHERLQELYDQDLFEDSSANLPIEDGVVPPTKAFTDYRQNSPLIQQISDGSGIISQLEEQCFLRKGSWRAMLTQMKSRQRGLEQLREKVFFDVATNGFTIHHYHGDVVYNPEKFMSKNMDVVYNDVLNVMSGSSKVLISHMFKAPVAGREKKATGIRNFVGQLESVIGVLTEAGTGYKQIQHIRGNPTFEEDSFAGQYIWKQL